MYEILKNTSRVVAVLSAVALVFAASVNADARDRAGAVGRSMAPAGVAVNEILGMDVRTHTGEEIASIDDVIVSQNGQVMDVVLDYEGDLVAVPIGDLRFTDRDYVVYAGTRSDLDAARDHYVYGEGPYMYSRGYVENSAPDVTIDRKYVRPHSYGTWPQSGFNPPSGFGHRDPSESPSYRDYDRYDRPRGYVGDTVYDHRIERDYVKPDAYGTWPETGFNPPSGFGNKDPDEAPYGMREDDERYKVYGYYGYEGNPDRRAYGTWPESGFNPPTGFGNKDPHVAPYGD